MLHKLMWAHLSYTSILRTQILNFQISLILIIPSKNEVRIL